MATKKSSAEKRHEQSEKWRMHNKEVKSRVHTSVRKYLNAIGDKDQAVAKERLTLLQGELDKALKKGVIKQNACSRKKSRMSSLYNKTFS